MIANDHPCWKQCVVMHQCTKLMLMFANSCIKICQGCFLGCCACTGRTHLASLIVQCLCRDHAALIRVHTAAGLSAPDTLASRPEHAMGQSEPMLQSPAKDDARYDAGTADVSEALAAAHLRKAQQELQQAMPLLSAMQPEQCVVPAALHSSRFSVTFILSSDVQACATAQIMHTLWACSSPLMQFLRTAAVQQYFHQPT